MSSHSEPSTDLPKPTKTLRASSGSTRLTAGGSAPATEENPGDYAGAPETPPRPPSQHPAPASGSAQMTDAFDRAEASQVKTSSAGVKMSGSAKRKGPRTVRLTVAKIDSWSVMKMSFLMSVALGIATVVAFFVLWLVLQMTGVMDSMEATLRELAGTESAERVIGLFSLGRVLSVAVILAVVNVILMTALSTLLSILYNIGSSMVNGFSLTLKDE